MKERDCFKNRYVDWRVILKFILNKTLEGKDLFRLGQDSEKGRVIVNNVINIRIPYKGGEDFSTSLVAFSFLIETLIRGACYEVI